MVFDILENLVAMAIPYVRDKEVDRAREIDEELTKVPELFKLINKVPFDPEKFDENTPGGAENFWEPKGFPEEHKVKNTTKIRRPHAGAAKTP